VESARARFAWRLEYLRTKIARAFSANSAHQQHSVGLKRWMRLQELMILPLMQRKNHRPCHQRPGLSDLTPMTLESLRPGDQWDERRQHECDEK
jgi:hypothetical protein